MTLLHHCKPFSLPLGDFSVNTNKDGAFYGLSKWRGPRTPLSVAVFFKTLTVSWNSSARRRIPVSFCSQNDDFEKVTGAGTSELPGKQAIQGVEELGLLGKPTPKPSANGSVAEVETKPQKPDEDEVLEPFLKFFEPRDSLGESSDSEKINGGSEDKEEKKKVSVEYYEPNPGEFVVGVVVSGNENRLDVNVGADMLGTMLTKEVLPLYDKETDYLLCDTDKDAEEFMVHGKMGIVRYDDALNGDPVRGRPVVEPGTVLFAEVLGRTLSGRPLLSTRRFFRRISWHRVRLSSSTNLLRLRLQSGTLVAY